MKDVAGASLANSQELSDYNSNPTDDVSSHESQGHLNTLVSAHKILNNPDHMARVHALVGRHTNAVKGLKSVDDLKSIFNEKYGNGGAQAPGKQQENDQQYANVSSNHAAGNDGNDKIDQFGKMGHSKPSKVQPNPLHYKKVGSSGTGNDGN